MIFISKADYTEHDTTILAHEQQHIRLGHFYDLLLLEIAKMIHWFNPIVYWLSQDIKAIHEFQADRHTLTSGIDVNKYQLLIIEKGVGLQKFALANSFNHCQIKKRITMMNKQMTSKAGIWKVATFLPLLALLLIFCSRKNGNELSTYDRCEVVNVSKCGRSIFTIELSADKIDDSSDTAYYSNPKNLVYLIVTSKNMSELADGEYRFTSFPRYRLDSMTFTGIAYVNKIENKIDSGTVALKKTGDKINISFQMYANHSFSKEAITGSYIGSYNFEDRSIKSENTMKMKHSLKELSNANDSNLYLSIEANYKGNFIKKQRCSLYSIIKAYDALKRTNTNNPITVSVKNSSEYRIREISEILGLPDPIPPINQVDRLFH